MSDSSSSFSWSIDSHLEQSVQDLYAGLLNHSAAEITCWPVTEEIVAIVLEDVTTLPERLLIEGGYQETATVLRRELMTIFKERLRKMLSNQYQKSVKDILGQYQPKTGRMSLMIVQG